MPKTSEAQRAYQKQWRLDNRDKVAKKNKKYRENNKDKIIETNKKYYENNKEEIAKKMKEYNKTPAGKKSMLISNWKHRGLICEDYDSLYGHYINATGCDECSVTFGEPGDGSGTFKCMDHCHETGVFRNFLCCGCNNRRG